MSEEFTYANFREAVKRYAECILEESEITKENAPDDFWELMEACDERLTETIDGSYYTIYHSAAWKYLSHSSNKTAIDEWLDETGGEAPTQFWDFISLAAFCAIRKDVTEELERIHEEWIESRDSESDSDESDSDESDTETDSGLTVGPEEEKAISEGKMVYSLANSNDSDETDSEGA
jgi:hypothetical protein